MSNLAHNIKALRIQAGLSQWNFAQWWGVGKKVVSTYETGNAVPPLRALRTLSDKSGYTLDELIREKLPMKKGNAKPIFDAGPLTDRQKLYHVNN
jgi:DNA-binding XRE family transcriptional regulator